MVFKGIKLLVKEAKYYSNLEGSIWRIGKKFLLANTFLKLWVNSPSYNKLYKRKIKKYTQKADPKFLQIENTNMCNARCIICPHSTMKRKQETMSQKDFEKFLDNVMRDYPKIITLTITGIGEPMIDKGVIEKIKYVNKKYPLLEVDIYSNAAVLTDEFIESLLNTNLHKINFSINGTERVYNKIMGLNYAKTTKNIMKFINKKNELNKKFPLVNISLMIIEENKEEVDKFQKQWIDKVDSVMIYMPSNWGGKHNFNMVSATIKPKRWPCTDLWRYITVNVSGDVILCRRDYEATVKLGNLHEQRVKEIFEGEKINNLRKRQVESDFSMELCNKCANVFDSSLNWWSKR